MKLAQAAIRPVTLAFVVFGATVLALFASYTTTDDLKHQLTNLEYQELLVGSIVEDLEQISVRPEAVQSAQISSMRSRLQSLIDTADFCCVVDAVTTQDSLIAGLKMVGRLKKGHPLGDLVYRGPGSAALGHPWPPRHLHILCFIVPPSPVRTTHSRIQKKATRWVTFFCIGGARRDRTADLNTASVALSQLSYGPESLRRAF